MHIAFDRAKYVNGNNKIWKYRQCFKQPGLLERESFLRRSVQVGSKMLRTRPRVPALFRATFASRIANFCSNAFWFRDWNMRDT
jgi:hypothetical protein